MNLAPYSLGKLIDWKLVFSPPTSTIYKVQSPYSLGKLIDWKRLNLVNSTEKCFPVAPYSLGKLIDWKHRLYLPTRVGKVCSFSLLAREINWLETWHLINFPLLFWMFTSLLAREINWLETDALRQLPKCQTTLSISLLAREINWLETTDYGYQARRPSSVPLPTR